MPRFWLRLFLLFFTASCVFSRVKIARAITADLKTTITVSETSTALVTHTITLTNTDPTEVATHFGFRIGSGPIEKAQVSVEKTIVDANILTTTEGTTIGIDLPQLTLGQDNKQHIVISYIDPAAVWRTGNTHRIQIPGITSSEYASREVEITVPSSFGQPTKSWPETSQHIQTDSTQTSIFTQVGAEPISQQYGDSQAYTLSFSAPLTNPSQNAGLLQLALPPDTQYQKSTYNKLEPKPTSVTKDPDGNWIASFRVEAQSTTTVQGELTIELTTTPHTELPTTFHKNLTNSTPHWTTQNASWDTFKANHTILETYQQLLAANALDATSITRNAEDTFHQNKPFSCAELADAVVTIARKNGVAARLVTGVTSVLHSESYPNCITSNQTLHSWVEIFDQSNKTWLPIDPVWEVSSGGVSFFNRPDLAHITLVTNGYSSDLPSALGSQTTPATFTLTPTATQQAQPQTSQLEVSFHPYVLWGIPLPGVYHLRVKNTGSQALYAVPISISTQPTISHFQSVTTLPSILPYETHEVTTVITTNTLLGAQVSEVQLALGSHASTHTVLAGPAYASIFNLPPVIIGLVTSGIAVTLATGSVLVFRHKRSSTIRR